MINPPNDPRYERMSKRIEKECSDYKRRMMRREHDWPPMDRLKKKWNSNGFDCFVAAGSMALCAYVKLPKGHPYYGLWHDDIELDVHFGLTFTCKVKDGWIIGWDYGHCGDWVGYHDPKGGFSCENPGRIWTVEDVEKEVEKATMELKRVSDDRMTR